MEVCGGGGEPGSALGPAPSATHFGTLQAAETFCLGNPKHVGRLGLSEFLSAYVHSSSRSLTKYLLNTCFGRNGGCYLALALVPFTSEDPARQHG